VRARGSSKNRGRISEVDAVSSQIGASFLGIPLEGHELTVCTIVHTRKHGAPRRLFLGAISGTRVRFGYSGRFRDQPDFGGTSLCAWLGADSSRQGA